MYDLIADNYSSIFPVEDITVEFINTYLMANNSKSILDIGCATGDLSIALSHKGYLVSGFDLNARMIDIAKTKTSNSLVNFSVGNMLELDKNITFDCVICLGNTMPHVASWQQLNSLINTLYTIVNDNGFVIIQILNYDRILHDKKIDFQTKEDSNYIFKRQYTNITSSSITFEIEFYDKKSLQKHTDSTELLPIERKRLVDLMIKNGFKNINVFSDYDRNPATKNDYYNVFVAQKKI